MRNVFIRLLLLLLGFSYVLYVSAIPATRTQILNPQDKSSLLSLTDQLDTLKLGNGEEQQPVDVDEGFIERRMILETQDYGWTGANTNHDPNAPGRI